MDSILKSLHDHFYRTPDNTLQEKRIKANNQLLCQRLSCRNRKLVLRIMDDKDLICSDFSLDSFICGFRLECRLQIKYKITTGVRITAKGLSRTPVSYFQRR